MVGAAEGDAPQYRRGAGRGCSVRGRAGRPSRGARVTVSPARIAAAFEAACLDELEAPKPGNVHRYADGHRMTADDFVRSAVAAARPLSQTGARVGQRILGAVEATVATTGSNT